ncbi:hypothetical protein [Haloarcula laminariae]|uniref:hypothetical protein n=1 Tax=Haloarcula laminariae TaxID=2961577 RepID=UPI0024051A7E|nr:hypothetical protein [Halomicroarcula sp. FL173]
MKLVTWNCNQAFRKKQHQLLKLDPEIIVVLECENPAEQGDWSEFTDWRWTGDNPHKGIGGSLEMVLQSPTPLRLPKPTIFSTSKLAL